MNRGLHGFFSNRVQHLHVLHVFERIVLLCPYAWGRDHLREAIADLARHTQAGEVSVRFEPGSDPLGSDEPWHVSWTAANSAAPDFHGLLAIRLESSHRGGVLELSGDCIPRDAAGFDVETGTRLASSTARDLLAQIGSALERRYKNAVFLA